VLELLNGDMETILHRDRESKKLSLFQRMEWAMQAAEGMAWLHGAGIIHRDMVSAKERKDFFFFCGRCELFFFVQ
jgi:serine/threonine protein kinase